MNNKIKSIPLPLACWRGEKPIFKKEWVGQGEWCGTQITCTNKHAVTKPCISRAIHRWNTRIINIRQNKELLEALKDWSANKQEINTLVKLTLA
jgi:hypothetical protein